MNWTLKRVILDYIFDNKDVWGLTNHTVNEFRQYIYDDKGEFIIGGEQVYNFIKQAEKLVVAK